ncbi:hypothetical protein [Paenibacillus harenae]|nr:hypothetical protein [Paenibacillus harenae]MDQ0062360.1 hypothetical protein [Paenibacillus harenae]
MKSNRPSERVSHNPIMKATRSGKPVISLEEKKRQKQSYKSYYVGGDDAS